MNYVERFEAFVTIQYRLTMVIDRRRVVNILAS